MEALRPGLWTWTAPHPDWKPSDGGPNGWEQEVRSYALEARGTLILFDPMDPPAEIEARAASSTPAIVLTCAWHGRSATDLAERLGATIYSPELGMDELKADATPYRAGDRLLDLVEVQPSFDPSDAVLWIESHGALVTGDSLLGGDGGVRVPETWIPKDVTPAQFREAFRHLLELPVELFLPTHDDPVVEGARQKLAEALA
jgi:hypothetical protein